METILKVSSESSDIKFGLFVGGDKEWEFVDTDTPDERVAELAKLMKVSPAMLNSLIDIFETIHDSVIKDLQDIWLRQDKIEKRLAALEAAK